VAKFFMLWEVDLTKVPADRKERAAVWGPMVQMVKQQIKEGTTKDWGVFAGGLRGFSVIEGDEMMVSNTVQNYLPYVTFDVHPIISIEQMEKVIENLKK
jgi:hypothetical protein